MRCSSPVLAFAASFMSANVIADRSHMPRKIPSDIAKSSAGDIKFLEHVACEYKSLECCEPVKRELETHNGLTSIKNTYPVIKNYCA